MSEFDYHNFNDQSLPVNIEDEMRKSYLDYAMSVIIGRALPGGRDGLKPVHRRILYGIYEQGNTSGRAYKKSARIVGDVMGKYHPHGDSAIYDAVVRMAQDFSMRYGLVDGQGNFGSVDGDNPAAMRYTEVRLTKLAEELMRDDIDKDTIDWVPNYDGTEREPSVLPAKYPNLLVKDKRIEGISDLRDESDRDGIRVVMELKRAEVPEVVLNNLYRNTQMQTTFGIIFLAIVDNKPEVMDLPTMLRHFVEHRKEIVVRRTRFDLKKAEEREHILAGLVIALDNIDRVIAIIRGSGAPPDAKAALMNAFGFTDVQAQAILDMRLQRLTSLESGKIREEREEVLATIKKLREILGSEELVLNIISDELRQIKEAYGDKRRTEIVAEASEITIEDMIADEDMVITVSRGGYIKRSPLSLYRSQRRGGKGRIGMATKEEDIVEHLFVASTHAYVLVFTDKGRMYWLKVHAIPEVGPNARGKAIVNLLPIEAGENVRALLTVRDFPAGKFVVMTTRAGKIKKTELTAFSNVRQTGIIAIDINEGDDLYAARLSDGQSDIFIGTHAGRAIRFHESEVRPMGRGAAGVKGISLREGDSVVEVDVLPASTEAVADEAPEEVDSEEEITAADSRGHILTVTEKGFGKRTPVSAYPLVHRGGMGVINIKVTDKNGKVAGTANVVDDDQLLLITEQGMIIRISVRDLRSMGRSTQGVRVINVEENDRVVGAVKLVEKEVQGGLRLGADRTVN